MRRLPLALLLVAASACQPAAVAPPCPPVAPAPSVAAAEAPAPAPPAATAAAPASAVKPLDPNLPRPDVIARSEPIPGFMRGINLGNCLEAPAEGAWGTAISEQHFQMAEAAGFDHVRLPVRFTTAERMDDKPPYRVHEEFWKRVDWAIDEAFSHHLSIILDVHHFEGINAEPLANKQKLYALWRQIAARYAKRPKELAFEILNEPTDKLEPKLLNDFTQGVIKIMRANNPDRLIFADSYFWANARRLAELELPKDPNVVAEFHMYEPILFTHQGAPWMGPEYQTKGIVFPGPPSEPVTPVAAASKADWVAKWFTAYNTEPAGKNPSGPSAVFDYFDFASRYVQATGKRVYLGEFGADDTADEQSRENYVRLVRTEAERRGIGWAYWDDGGAFKAMNPYAGKWNEGLKSALLD